MSEATAPFGRARAPVLHRFAFRGAGAEFFRIWIVNLALTLVTLGIYSAWAKVRTRRYFYGNTFVADHSFDYHAAPLRILLGRAIALALFAGYNISGRISPLLTIPWILFFAVAIPWLIVSSQRFNARNTSYRNVRFNFGGDYWGAFKAFILWPLAGMATLGGLMPLAHRARDYYLVNHRSYGGKPFNTSFAGKSIYKIYLLALLTLILATFVIAASWVILSLIFGHTGGSPRGQLAATTIIVIPIFAIAWVAILTYIGAAALKLTLEKTSLDGRHKLSTDLRPSAMVWIAVSNLVLVLITIGIFYPWARVRYSRYLADHMALLAATDLDGFTSQVFATQSAVGEEIAGFFDFDIGL